MKHSILSPAFLTSLVVMAAPVLAQPVINGLTPLANSRSAPIGGTVHVQFDQTLNGGAGALQVFSNQRGGLRTGNSGTSSISANTLTFAPGFTFRPGETVAVTVTTAAQSASGALATPLVYQFTTATTGGTGVFGGGSEVGVGPSPYIVTTADVDGDGDLDLLTPNFNSGTIASGALFGTVSIRLNDGTGAFSGGTNPAVGRQPRGLAMGDLDGDGDLDMVTANYTSGTMSVRFNDGSGNFTGVTDLSAGTRPQSAALADLDGDGDLDALLSCESNIVGIYLNNGSGGFTNAPDVSVSGFPFSLTTADVDNDGDMDLLTGAIQGTTVSIRLNNGNGTFSGGADPIAGIRPRGLTTGDIDGDGDLDLVVANSGSNNVSVLVNNSGVFTTSATLPTGNFPGSVALGDVDGDGDLDLLSTNILGNSISIRLNNAGVFSGGSELSIGNQPYRVALADLNGDGALDLLAANFTLAVSTVSVRFNLQNLVVSSPLNVTGIYNNVTVTGPSTGGAGTGTLAGALTVHGNLTVQNGGTLLTGCQPLTGPGNFILAAGGTLGICDPSGIEAVGNVGSVQLAGSRTFSNDASYIYNGTAAQITGQALPPKMRNLTTTNTNDVALTAAATVAQVLTVAAAGNLVLGANVLTLPSDAAGTALVVNSGTGIIQGNQAVIERYLDPSVNPSLGYRHYSAPVTGATIADLATVGSSHPFTPMLNPSYNTSATPGTAVPFPTVYGYDQRRLTNSGSNFSAFDKGWVSPTTPSDALVVGRGYTVNIWGTEKVDFRGSLNTGAIALALGRNTGPSAADAGRHLVGNPYPAPLDWSRVGVADMTNLDGSMAVFESTSQYGGNYRFFQNGMGNPLIASSQGFFVRVSAGQTNGGLTFRDAHRITDYSQSVPMRRGASDQRPMVQLQLQGPTGPADVLFVYAERGATSNQDAHYDAVKIANPSGLNVSAIAADGTELAINGLPQLAAATVVPLAVTVPAAGTYTFHASEIRNLPMGLEAYLVDIQIGRQINLRQQSIYIFTSSSPNNARALAGRFQLRFVDSFRQLNTATMLLESAVALYPNPAHGVFTVRVPSLPGVNNVHCVLFNSMAQEVFSREVDSLVAANGFTVDASTLAKGIYTLRLQTATATAVKSVVVE